MSQTKTIVAGFGAVAALAGGSFMFQAPSHVSLFDYGNLTDEDYKFMSYVTEFGKSYETASEFKTRKEEFITKHKFIQAFNADTNNTHTVEHNKFSDRTQAEMKKLAGYIKSDRKRNPVMLDVSDNAVTIDWRNHNGFSAVSPVKDQSGCGSCWSFSTAGAVEGADAIKTGVLKSFSEQQLVSCSTENGGCLGGNPDKAFTYVESNPLQLEGDYQYVSGNGKVPACSYDKTKGVGTVSYINDVKQYDPDQLRAAIMFGPVSVAIDSSDPAFHQYKEGVISTQCQQFIDHAVLAVGYGTLNGIDYFLVKNSWGHGWGDQGYVKIGGMFNACGILQQMSYPNA